MSWEYVKTHGQGRLEFRLAIEGVPYDWVTAQLLAGVSGSQTRVNGLKRDTLRYSQNVDWINGTLDRGGMSFEIVDLEGIATSFFVQNPTKETFLADNITFSDTTIPVQSTSGWDKNDVAYLATEAMLIDAVDAVANTFTVVRDYQGSTALSYQANDTALGNTNAYAITDRPIRMAGRRVKLYAYDSDDNLQGVGTLVWQGVLSSEVQLQDMARYKLSAYSIAEKFKTQIGVDLENNLTPRGFYFPSGFELGILIFEGASATRGLSVPAWDTTDSIKCVAQGFYETADDLIDSLNNQILLQIAGAGFQGLPTFVINNGCLSFQFSTGGTPRWMYCYTLHGPLHGFTPPTPIPSTYAAPILEMVDFTDSTVFVGGDSSSPVSTVAANEIYIGQASQPLPAAMNVVYPNSTIRPHQPRVNAAWFRSLGLFTDTYPMNVLYMAAPVLPTNVYRIVPPQREDESTIPTMTIDTVDLVNRSITLEFVSTTVPMGWLYTEQDEFNLTTEYVADGNFFDFLEAVVNNTLSYSSLGITPNLTDNDIDLPDIRLLSSSINMPPYLANRSYAFGGKAIDFDKLVAEECKLYGIFPIINANAKISFAKLRDPSKSELGNITLSSSVLKAFPGFSRQTDKVINVSQLKAPYNPWAGNEDDNQNTYTVNYLDSIAQFGGKKKALTINPYSNFSGGDDVLTEDINSILWKPVATFGVPRTEVSLEVALNYFTATLGSPVNVISPYIPNPNNGMRGVNTVGIVRGLTWDLGKGSGKLEISMADNSYAGYAPNIIIENVEDNSNPTFTVSVTQNRYAPYGHNDIDYFFTNDKLEVWQLNNWNDTPLGCTASAVDPVVPTNFVLTFPAALNAAQINSLTSSVIGFPPFTGTLTEFQQRFCYISSGSFESYLSKFGA